MNEKQVNNEPTLTQCQPTTGQVNPENIDPVPKLCEDDGFPSQKRVASLPNQAWREPPGLQKWGVGQQANCDPILNGQIINDPQNPDRTVVNRYSRALRGADEAMLDLFRNVVVIDEQGQWHTVPIIWGTQERAVAAILQDNVRKDNSLVVDRIRLPMLAICSTTRDVDLERYTYHKAQSFMSWADPRGEGYGFTQQEKYERDTIFGVTRGVPVNIGYTLWAWTMYQEDMNQIVEQVLLRLTPVANLRIRGVYWEVIVTLDGQQNNLDTEPGDQVLRVFKYQFNMTAKSYIPQPITRYKGTPEPAFYPAAGVDVGALAAELRQDLGGKAHL